MLTGKLNITIDNEAIASVSVCIITPETLLDISEIEQFCGKRV
ncbi:hypothetical protein [Nostoc sp.]